MKKIFIIAIVMSMTFLSSCSSSKGKIDNEREKKLVKSIEVFVEGELLNTITFKYDDKNRLIEDNNEFNDGKHNKHTIIYADNEIKVFDDNTTWTYKYSNGKPTECNIEPFKLCTHYYYEGNKISCSKDDYDGSTTYYKWENGCLTESSEEKGFHYTYEYTNIRNTNSIDILMLSFVPFFVPSISSFGSWSSPEFLPSRITEIHEDLYYKKTVTDITYEYIIDDKTGNITSINITDKEKTYYEDGKVEEKTTIGTLKLYY